MVKMKQMVIFLFIMFTLLGCGDGRADRITGSISGKDFEVDLCHLSGNIVQCLPKDIDCIKQGVQGDRVCVPIIK